MDQTPEYLDMLKAAPKIQSLWSPNIGDYHTWNDDISVIGPGQFKSITGFEVRDKQTWGDKNQYGQYIVGYFKEWVIMDFNTTTPFKCKDIIKQFQEIYTSYKDALWLPRQDQLQDMLKDKIRHNHKNTYGYVKGPAPEGFIAGCLHQEFHKFMIYEDQYIFCEVFNSMEQLWLAFVMHEKYNKRWNDKEWV